MWPAIPLSTSHPVAGTAPSVRRLVLQADEAEGTDLVHSQPLKKKIDDWWPIP